MIEGRCLCGAVQYRYMAEIEQSILCFCKHCRLAQGSIMAWNSPLNRDDFKIIAGQECLKEYRHTPGKARVFCAECGSPIYSYRDDLPEVIRLRLGTVTQGIVPKPREFFYIDAKPSYIQLINDKKNEMNNST